MGARFFYSHHLTTDKFFWSPRTSLTLFLHIEPTSVFPFPSQLQHLACYVPVTCTLIIFMCNTTYQSSFCDPFYAFRGSRERAREAQTLVAREHMWVRWVLDICHQSRMNLHEFTPIWQVWPVWHCDSGRGEPTSLPQVDKNSFFWCTSALSPSHLTTNHLFAFSSTRFTSSYSLLPKPFSLSKSSLPPPN